MNEQDKLTQVIRSMVEIGALRIGRVDAECALKNAVLVGICAVPIREGREALMKATCESLINSLAAVERAGVLNEFTERAEPETLARIAEIMSKESSR